MLDCTALVLLLLLLLLHLSTVLRLRHEHVIKSPQQRVYAPATTGVIPRKVGLKAWV